MSYFLDIARKNSATGYRNGMVLDVDMAVSEVVGAGSWAWRAITRARSPMTG